jgi:hypothetical protein
LWALLTWFIDRVMLFWRRARDAAVGFFALAMNESSKTVAGGRGVGWLYVWIACKSTNMS